MESEQEILGVYCNHMDLLKGEDNLVLNIKKWSSFSKMHNQNSYLVRNTESCVVFLTFKISILISSSGNLFVWEVPFR